MESADCLTACRLESERLALEPLRPQHAEELAPVLDDIALHHFVGGRPESARTLRARFERQVIGRSPDGRERWLNWTVRVRSTGEAVGTMQATVGGAERQTIAELAWVVGVSHQRQGIAKESAALVASWLRTHGVSVLRAHIHPAHHASMGVARSIGLLATDVITHGEVRWESPTKDPGRLDGSGASAPDQPGGSQDEHCRDRQ